MHGGLNTFSHAPSASTTWTAIVLRAEGTRWDGRHFHDATVEQIDNHTPTGVSEPINIIRQRNFVAVVSPCAASAARVAKQLRITWNTDDLASCPPPTNHGSDYTWSDPIHTDPDATRAWASWTDQGELELQIEATHVGSLRAELQRLFGLQAAQIHLTSTGAHLPSRSTHADRLLQTHDAAIDAAIIARIIRQRVTVTSLAPELIRALTVRLENTGTAWTLTPSYPLAYRPAWSTLTAGTYDMPQRLSGDVVFPYDVDYNVAPASQSLTPQTAISASLAQQASVFGVECFVDEHAQHTQHDPIDWRLAHVQDPQGRALIQAVADRAGWTSRQPKADIATTLYGRGFACALTETTDIDGAQDKRAWSAWVVDVKVDTDSGHIDLTSLTVGHHVDGMGQHAALPAELHASIADETTRLLGGPRAYDDWTPSESTSLPDIKIAEPENSGVLASPSSLSRSPALMLPLAAAISNAIYQATGLRLHAPPFNAQALQHAALTAAPTPALPYAFAIQQKKPSTWRRTAAWTAALATAGAGMLLAALPWRGAIAPVTPDLSVYSAGAIERGRLIAAASDCVVCHTAPGGQENAGGLAMDTPFGTIYSTNITPDPVNGIGTWSYQAFDRAMRHGISQDGSHLYPAFPYTSFAKFSDADMQALYAYMMTQPAVESAPPKTELSFPFNQRPMMAGWNMLFHDATPFEPDPSRTTLWNRGAYLVNGAGHCSACHTPRNAFGAEKTGFGQFLSGANIDEWDAPALNALTTGPLPWSKTELYTYLRTGHSARHGVAAGPMAPVIAGLSELNDHDILAMATYLTELPGSTTTTVSPTVSPDTAKVAALPEPDLATMRGQGIYEGSCAACHDPGRGLPLFGVRPNLATNTNILATNPDNLIHVILQGITEPAQDNLGYMPGFAEALNDQQITDVVHYLRATYGADQPAWTNVASTVAALRHHRPTTQEVKP
jgi:nicotinate dehydrogenase subunit B